MMTYVPSYYDRFQCLASACRHTCCRGWEIDIDEDTFALYQTMTGELGEKLKNNIVTDEDGAHMRLDEKENCPFLTQKGLCELILKGGEDLLCDICTLHPRYINAMETLREVGLGLSCEAACRLVLSFPEKTTLVRLKEEDGEEQEPLTEEEQACLAARDRLFARLQDRNMPFSSRLCEISRDHFLYPWLTGVETVGLLAGLESMDPAWDERVEKLKTAANQDEMPLLPYEMQLEQLAVYIVTRHFIPVYQQHGEEAAVRLCLFLIHAVRYMALEQAAEKGSLEEETLLELVRQYSEEIEYSDQNIEEIIERLS